MWVTLNAMAGAEFSARDRLTDLGLYVYCATYKKVIRPRRIRKLRTAITPLLPRYLFLQTSMEQLARDRATIRQRTSNVWPVRLNGFGYLQVPDNDIVSLKTRQESGEFDMLQQGETCSIKLGTFVFVISGPLQGRKGTVAAKLRKDIYRVDVHGGLVVTLAGEHLSTTSPSA